MAPSKRKRFNAFEDFPASENKQNQSPLSETQTLKESVTTVERIERLKPSEMMPDRFQPRRLLPTFIRVPFYNGEINCYQAAQRWLHFANQDSGVRQEVDRLLHLGSSFEDHGQIKPITGSWQNDADGQFFFLIETGERRFWAACLQTVQSVPKHHNGELDFNKLEEPVLRVEVVQNPTRQRQVLENRHAEAPSAVEQACEVAALILADLDIHPDETIEDDFDYFRQANDKRMPAGLWDRIIPIMNLTRPRMVQLIKLFDYPNHLLEIADRFRLSERVLREIRSRPQQEWEQLIHQSITNSLTSEDIAEQMVEPEQPKKPQSPKQATTPETNAYRGLRKFTRVFKDMNKLDQSQVLDYLADEITISGQSQQVLELLDELSQLIKARHSRR
jgi:hypothetical protein